MTMTSWCMFVRHTHHTNTNCWTWSSSTSLCPTSEDDGHDFLPDLSLELFRDFRIQLERRLQAHKARWKWKMLFFLTETFPNFTAFWDTSKIFVTQVRWCKLVFWLFYTHQRHHFSWLVEKLEMSPWLSAGFKPEPGAKGGRPTMGACQPAAEVAWEPWVLNRGGWEYSIHLW